MLRDNTASANLPGAALRMGGVGERVMKNKRALRRTYRLSTLLHLLDPY